VASPLRWRRLLGGPALVLTAALAVAGCASATAGTGSTSANTPARAAAAAITTAQASQVFNSYVATTAEAIKTGDGKLALSVVTGVQQAVVSTAVKEGAVFNGGVSGGSGSGGGVSVCSTASPAGESPTGEGCFYGHPKNVQYTYGTPAFYLPEPGGYPRFFVVDVTLGVKGIKPAEGAVASVGGAPVPVDGPALMLFEQATDAGPWQLASVSQFPAGMMLPRLATDKNGYIPQVRLTSTDLLAQPYASGALQAAVVDDGPASAAAKAVADGPLTTAMYQAARDRSGTGLSVPGGDSYQWDMEGTAYPAFALRTADGGALVLYAMYLNSTVATPSYINKGDPIESGSPIEVPQDLSPLLPAGQPTPRTMLEEQDLFSFAAIDPPAGPAKIQVIAIGGGLNYAAAS
jgi:hypothetical protein